MGCCMSSCSRQSKASRRHRKRTSGKRRRNDVLNDPRRPNGEMGDEELQLVPGRLCTNGASDVACVFTQQGRKGTNQDAMIVWENFASRDDTIFCGVFDGHGPYGHLVAKKVRDTLPVKVYSQWKTFSCSESNLNQNNSAEESRNSDETGSMDEEWIQPLDNSQLEKFPEAYNPLRQSLLNAYKLMDKELKSHPTIDGFCSGSTAVTLIKQGQDLIIANVGDSRAVLGTRDKDNVLVAIQLTVDLKPNLPSEAARIQQCKGRVFALQDEPEVARVWLPNSDSPGLAMARAFGDFCLKDYGLISVPDTSYRCLTEKDEFIVLASDGVWDVLSNKEVVDVVASAPTRGTAARALVDSAVRAWRLKFPTSKTDDCAVVCLYVHPPSLSDQEYELSTPKTSTDNITPTAIASAEQGVAANANEVHAPEFDSSQPICSPGDLMLASAGVDEIETLETPKVNKLQNRSPSTMSLADCISMAEEEEWSALEGVTRVNSLLNLPRFLSGAKRPTSRKK